MITLILLFIAAPLHRPVAGLPPEPLRVTAPNPVLLVDHSKRWRLR